MPTRFLRPGLFVAGWVGATLLLYVALLGADALTTNLDVQMHNTFFVVSPGYVLLGLALLLAPLAGMTYPLLMRRPTRAVAWTIGLLALLLLYLLSDAIEVLAHVTPVRRFQMHEGYAPDLVPAEPSFARVLRVLQLLMGVVALLAGRALGRQQGPQAPAPDSRS